MEPPPEPVEPLEPVEPSAEPASAPEPERISSAEELLAAAVADYPEWLVTENEFELVESHVDNIINLIQHNWKRPPSARRHMTVLLTIDIAPGGAITHVAIQRGSGNHAFDRAAANAVRKVRRFTALDTLPTEIFERHFRRLSVLFQPEDLSW